MIQTGWLSEFSCLSAYTQLYPILLTPIRTDINSNLGIVNASIGVNLVLENTRLTDLVLTLHCLRYTELAYTTVGASQKLARYYTGEKSFKVNLGDSQFRRKMIYNFIISKIYGNKRLRVQ